MPDRTKAVFDRTAATYDPGRARLIPCYDRLYKTAVDLLPETAEHILDLGAGTGLLSVWIRERFPAARLHLVDNCEPMLAQARQRFTGDPHVTFELADYTHLHPTPAFDAIVSALSIHHLEDLAKQALFLRIRAALKPEGIFINAEQILAPRPALETQAKADWLTEVRALGATEDQVAASLLRQAEDRCATIEHQLDWLQQAGFSETRCCFHQGRFAVLYAR